MLICKHTPAGEIRYTYNSMGRLISVLDTTGERIGYGYNCHGKKTYEEAKISDTVTRKITWRYDRADRLIEKCEALNSGLEPFAGERKHAVTSFSYDENGNQTQVITPEGYRIKREYDSRDRLISERVVDKSGGIDRTTTIDYDLAGNITRICRQGAGEEAHEIACGYDLKNRITHVKESDGAVFGYEYDSNDRIVRRLLPDTLDMGLHSGNGATFGKWGK